MNKSQNPCVLNSSESKYAMTRSILQWHAKSIQWHLFPKYEYIVWPNLYFSHISLALFNRHSQSTALIQTEMPPFFAEWWKVFSPKNHCGLKASRTFEIASPSITALWSLPIWTNIICASIVLRGRWRLCLMLAAPA